MHFPSFSTLAVLATALGATELASAAAMPANNIAARAGACTTTTTLIWVNNNGANYDLMGFTVSGKYNAVSDGASNAVVWDGNDASNANPKVSSLPGPLPAYLDEYYDHDSDWVQFNYGSQEWASSDPQCKDSGWGGSPPIATHESRVITCTFDC